MAGAFSFAAIHKYQKLTWVSVVAINTPLDLITFTLRRAMVEADDQTPSARTVNDAFDALNLMIAGFNRSRYLLWALDDIAFQSDGSQSYTIGTGQQFNTERPDRLEYAYTRLLPVNGGQTLDSPLYLIQSREEYSAIVLKALSTWPTSVFLDTQYPVSFLNFWPIPPANQYQMHVVVKNQITQFASLTQQIVAPPEYLDALSWNLVCRLRPAYGMAADPQAVALAKLSLQTLRKANMQIPPLQLPYGYPRRGNYGYGYTIGITGGFA